MMEEEGVDEAAIEREFAREQLDFDVLGVRGQQQDTEILRRCILNEKAAPDLLMFQDQIVRNLKKALAEQQEDVDSGKGNNEEALKCTLMEMEMARVKYIICEYLRVRLRKIERYALYLLKNETLQQNMSKHEVAFLKKFIEMKNAHFTTLVVNKLPKVHQSLDESTDKVDMVPKPNRDAFVFCKVLEDLGNVQVDDALESDTQMLKGDTFAIRYRIIRRFLNEDKVLLL